MNEDRKNDGSSAMDEEGPETLRSNVLPRPSRADASAVGSSGRLERQFLLQQVRLELRAKKSRSI
jgi:hypothetical protein